MGKRSSISGISESRVAPIAAKILEESPVPGLIVVASPLRGKRLAEDLTFFYKNPIYTLPEEDEVFLRYEAKNHDELFQRITALKAMIAGEPCAIIATLPTTIKKMPPHEIFEKHQVFLRRGAEVDLEELRAQLSAMGYERVPLVEARGEYSLRGGILDIYTSDGIDPYRIEFFDTEIDSIRTFDLDSQRSFENLRDIQIPPAEQLIRDEEVFKKAAASVAAEYDARIRQLRKKQGMLTQETGDISLGSDSEFALGLPPGSGSDLSKIDSEAIIGNLEKRRDQLVEFIESGTNLQMVEHYLHYFYRKTDCLLDYLKEDSIVILDDPDRIIERFESREKEAREDFQSLLERGILVPSDKALIPDRQELQRVFSWGSKSGLASAISKSGQARGDFYIFTPFQKIPRQIGQVDHIQHVDSKQPTVFNGHMELLETELKRYVKNGYQVTLVCANQERITNLGEFLERIDLEGRVALKEGSLTGGIEYPKEKVCYIWDGDIFTGKKQAGARSRKSKAAGKQIKTFSDMKTGDFVVHENHGIGKFLGIRQLTVQEVKKDYLTIKYGGEDMLYVPVEQMDLIQKYVGGEGTVPKLNKLAGSEWKKTKAKTKAAIAEMAEDLLALSAKRQSIPGYAFSPDTPWQREFEETFPYTETEDQLRCIREIKEDMEKSEAMDRLLCGDVGFGKTEVAARALFKCVAEGKQAAILVPTTILANQHYYTMKDRFERFPFKVEMLSRFRSPEEQKEIVSRLRTGAVDLVIGTHRLLSQDVSFKDLGLLVIDEEQRFGVRHKEVIKELRANVDVLTLSATPIPRTLHMSLLGIKNMSLIAEPPEERYPVKTYVMETDEGIMADAIERELARGGQVYVLSNRVKGISRIAATIKKLVPEAKVSVGHGQMGEHELEDIMLEFINGETNVLVATTIIESGIDIPNVNTILILDADRFGLSQLYQLRGRVGRSNRLAYAYLLYHKDKILTEVAEKRLRAIKEFTEFGAGFKVAMRDLEIRGAGNILGTSQSGHMAMVGYELYCKLMDEAVRALKGEVVNPDREESSIEIQVTAFIPDTYIGDEVLKLQMYKKIAGLENRQDEEEIKDELMDRFGDIPGETLALIQISRIRALAESLCITRVHQDSAGKLVSDFAVKNTLKGESLMKIMADYGKRIFVHGGSRPFIRFTPDPKKPLDSFIEFLEGLVG